MSDWSVARGAQGAAIELSLAHSGPLVAPRRSGTGGLRSPFAIAEGEPVRFVLQKSDLLAEEVPSVSLRERVALAVRRAAERVGRRFHDTRYLMLVSRLEREIAKLPESIPLWRRLIEVAECEGDSERAGNGYRNLAVLYKSKGDLDRVSHCYRKMIQLGYAEPARLYRDLATFCVDTQKYDAAATACRRVVELYLESGHEHAAAGFVRNLPRLGALAPKTKAELERLLGRPVETKREIDPFNAAPNEF